MVQAEFCYAPVSDSVPEHLKCHLPQRFLDSAVVDSFATEARLKHLHPDQFPVTILVPHYLIVDQTVDGGTSISNFFGFIGLGAD